jgi:DNA-binding IclR family transcriptional regulator
MGKTIRRKARPAAAAAAPPDHANSLERMIGILDLFETETKRWTFDAMHQRLGYTRSTLYRYLKVLSDAELLTSLPEAGYTLGPRIIELDYGIRTHDPLIQAARPVMSELVQEIPGVALLCRRYRDKVLCVHQERGSSAIQSTYERGKPQPLVRGAASRVILAHLPPAALARLVERQPREFADAGLGRTVARVRDGLKDIRQAGWDHTTGDVTPGVRGIAAPIFDNRRNVLGSLSITMAEKGMDARRLRAVADRVMFCARVVTTTIAGTGPA